MARLFQTNRDPHSDCRAKKRGLLCSPRTTCRHRTTSRQERSTPKSLTMFRSVSDRMQSWGRAQSEVLASRPARQGSPRTRRLQHLGCLPRSVSHHACHDLPRGRTSPIPGPSPSGLLAAPAVSFGALRAACQMRMSRDPPRETESAPNPSPLGHLAAKTVALGPFRGICGTTAAKDRARARISLMRAL